MTEPRNKGRYYPTGLFGWWGNFIVGIGLPWLMFKDDLPHGHGSGSDIANGFVVFTIPIFALTGAVLGATIGALFGFILYLLEKTPVIVAFCASD